MATTRILVPYVIPTCPFFNECTRGASAAAGTLDALPRPMATHFPVLHSHTLVIDRVHQARHLARQLAALLKDMAIQDSESSADLIEAAKASNEATRTMLQHATKHLEDAGHHRCKLDPDGITELCYRCGRVLDKCLALGDCGYTE